MIPNQEEKDRLDFLCSQIIDLIHQRTRNIEEKAYTLKMLVESFQETSRKTIVINKPNDIN